MIINDGEVVPTLFIACGGTGAEILLRIRRRILNKLWGPKDQPVRLERLEYFPYAAFLQIDLDASTATESGKAARADILREKVRFKEEERLVKKLDFNRYARSDEDLNKYPIIKEWFPLSRNILNELNYNYRVYRSISRLYFFDKYQEIKSAIRNKCSTLLSDDSSDALQKRLGLKVQTGALKIVVVASTSGNTGSGIFLDLGYLSGLIGKEAAKYSITTNLVLVLPTAFQQVNLRQNEANTYAALMEMETCMRGSRYIHQWVEGEVPRDMPSTPYSDVYLVDTANLAGAKTADIKDLYDMISDSLFDDFSTAEFANKKRAISIIQNQHKVIPYEQTLPQETCGDTKVLFSRAYSSFGRSEISVAEQKGDEGSATRCVLPGPVDTSSSENPLFAALDAHPNLGQLLGDFIMRAMPWVDAKLDGYLKPQGPENQYMCLIGVKNAKKFEEKYGALLKSRLPTVTMMTEKQIRFVETDTPGKVVCHTELAGIPLPSLKAIDQWYVNYREESERIPVHTHRLTSTFVHAREMTLEELTDRADDFKLFVQAVALGVLTRTARGEDAGTYCFKMRGKTIAIGDEKRLRMNGFPDQHKAAIRDAVGSELDALASNDQLAMWVALLEHYVNAAYPLCKVMGNGEDKYVKSLPTWICESLVEEWTARLKNKATNGAECLLNQAYEKLAEWTEEVTNSTADPYLCEVNQKELQDKRVLKREVLQVGWSFGWGGQAQQPASAAAMHSLTIPAYWVAVDGQPNGPHAEAALRALVASGKLMRESKVWKDGMAAWVSAADVSDLASLFVVPPPLGGMPPPL